jgi:phenylacetate-CoA ligase
MSKQVRKKGAQARKDKKTKPPINISAKVGSVTTIEPSPKRSMTFNTGLAWPILPNNTSVQAMALQVQFSMIEWWSGEKIRKYQLAQLQQLIDHAQKTIPYYKEVLQPLAGKELGTLTLADYRKIPVLLRSMIQEKYESQEMVSTALPSGHGNMFEVRTSGSTGRPMKAQCTNLTGLMHMAQGIRFHMWHKRDLSLKNMNIRRREADFELSRTRGWTPGSTGISIGASQQWPMPRVLDILLDEDPAYVQCYPATLRELLRLSKIKGVKPKSLLEVRTASEILEPELVVRAKSQWGIKVSNNYSANELSIIALTCPDNPDAMHVMSESLLLEVLNDKDEPCVPGETGRCVVTTLANFAMPLIRYEYGDYAEVGTPCSCGRGLPVINRIIGRKHNMFVLPNGDKFTAGLPPDDALFELPIKQYQLVQTSYEEVEVRVVTDRKLTKAEESRITGIYSNRQKYPFNFVLKYMEEIPELSNGKYELFRSEVDT